jgi:hypothetical protein
VVSCPLGCKPTGIGYAYQQSKQHRWAVESFHELPIGIGMQRVLFQGQKRTVLSFSWYCSSKGANATLKELVLSAGLEFLF